MSEPKRPLLAQKDPTQVVVRAYMRFRQAGMSDARAVVETAQLTNGRVPEVFELLREAARHPQHWPSLAEVWPATAKAVRHG